LLSFGLANHVHRMKREMQDAKEALNQELSRSLEKVEAQVQEKTRDIRLILQTIQQGIFTVHKPGLMIHEEHSSALLSILGQDRVAGKALNEIFLKLINLGSDQQSQVEGILNASLGEDPLSFEMNS